MRKREPLNRTRYSSLAAVEESLFEFVRNWPEEISLAGPVALRPEEITKDKKADAKALAEKRQRVNEAILGDCLGVIFNIATSPGFFRLMFEMPPLRETAKQEQSPRAIFLRIYENYPDFTLAVILHIRMLLVLNPTYHDKIIEAVKNSMAQADDAMKKCNRCKAYLLTNSSAQYHVSKDVAAKISERFNRKDVTELDVNNAKSSIRKTLV